MGGSVSYAPTSGVNPLDGTSDYSHCLRSAAGFAPNRHDSWNVSFSRYNTMELRLELAVLVPLLARYFRMWGKFTRQTPILRLAVERKPLAVGVYRPASNPVG